MSKRQRQAFGSVRRRLRLVGLLTTIALPPQAFALHDLTRAFFSVGLDQAAYLLPFLFVAANLPLVFVVAKRRMLRGPWGELALLPFSVAGIGSLLYLPLGLLFRLAQVAGLPLPWWLALVPFALILYGALIGQRWMQPSRVEVPIEGLPSVFSGFRLVQLSDLHLGGFVSEARLRRIARHAARLHGDAVVVTGDIVDRDAQHARRAGEILASIPAPLGVFACLGNHDHYAGAGRVAEDLRAAGVRLLVNQGVALERGGEKIWLCGIDDITFGGQDLRAALEGRPDGVPAVLLAHNPNFFPAAARAGVALTLSGHTHGGQFGIFWLHRALSLARLITRYVAGLYQIGESYLYVSRGAGLVMPMRLGARPEVTELVLVPAAEPVSSSEPIPAA